MDFDSFIKKWTGQPIDFDGVYPNQCMDLMHEYIYEVLGLIDKSILAAPTAAQVYKNFINEPGQSNFTKIDNTPTGVPTKGDIVFLDANVPGITGDAGHVCIFVSGDSNNFKSFDANYPTGSLPHIQEHTYAGCLGWLHPNVTGQAQVAVDKITFQNLVHGSTQWDDSVAKYIPNADPKTTDFTGLQSVVGGIQSVGTNCQNNLNQAISDMATLKQQIINDDEKLALETEQRQDDAKTYQAEIDALKASQPNSDKLVAFYTSQIGVLQGQVKQLQSDKHDLALKLAQATSGQPTYYSIGNFFISIANLFKK